MRRTEGQKLPKGWTWATLGEMVQPTRPKHNPADYPDLPFIGMEHIEAHTMRLLGTVLSGTMRSNAVHFMPHDVLYGRLRPYLNKVFLPDFEGLCSAEFIVFPYAEHLNMKYVQYLLNSSAFVSFATHLNEGDRPRVDFFQLSIYPVPIPPLPEQHRIIAEIETQFTRLDAVVIALKRVQANLKRYRASVLQAACTGCLVSTEAELARVEGRSYESADQLLQRILQERRTKWESEQLTAMKAEGKIPKDERWKSKYSEPVQPDTSELPELPEGWVWSTLSQVAEIQGGIQKQPKRRPIENYYPYLRVANVLRNKLDLSEVHEIELFGDELQRLRLKAGDLLIVEGNGSSTEIGRMAIWNDVIENCVHQNHIIRARPWDEFLPTFIVSYWNSPEGSRRVMHVASSTSGLYTLSVSKVSQLPIPIPPVAEQRRIIAEVERRLSVIDELEAVIATNLKRTDRLRQAILKRAFEGKLVPQDPTDEPASVLLERIRTERELPAEKPKVAPPQAKTPQPTGQLKVTVPVQGELALEFRQ